mmetsp:Transcript_103120/g.269244  ORF Transcript_103120/g.269244 Transcript_103120/m.269244 type:complete len:258 (+) Transcript_103120:315-1088(+)
MRRGSREANGGSCSDHGGLPPRRHGRRRHDFLRERPEQALRCEQAAARARVRPGKQGPPGSQQRCSSGARRGRRLSACLRPACWRPGRAPEDLDQRPGVGASSEQRRNRGGGARGRDAGAPFQRAVVFGIGVQLRLGLLPAVAPCAGAARGRPRPGAHCPAATAAVTADIVVEELVGLWRPAAAARQSGAPNLASPLQRNSAAQGQSCFAAFIWDCSSDPSRGTHRAAARRQRTDGRLRSTRSLRTMREEALRSAPA